MCQRVLHLYFIYSLKTCWYIITLSIEMGEANLGNLMSELSLEFDLIRHALKSVKSWIKKFGEKVWLKIFALLVSRETWNKKNQNCKNWYIFSTTSNPLIKSNATLWNQGSKFLKYFQKFVLRIYNLEIIYSQLTVVDVNF